MFRRIPWSKRQSRKKSRQRLEKVRSLSFESLESRRVFAGIVNIDVGGGLVGVAAGNLGLWGDTSNNEVEIRGTLNPNEFQITGRNGTLLTVDGGVNTMTTFTVNGITLDIFVDLGDVGGGHANTGGVDTFRFLGQTAGISSAPRDVYLINSSGSNTNVLTDVLVNRNLFVTRAHFNGYTDLQVSNSEITGIALVDNDGGGGLHGDSKTMIDQSLFHASAGGPALVVQNGIGTDVFTVNGNSQFGDGSPQPPANPIVLISNGDGPTMTVFTGSSKVYGPGTTTIYGNLDIVNDTNVQGTVDVTTFNQVNVFGEVTITNGAGNTETRVLSSELYSDLIPGPAGAGVTVTNDAGFDSFEAIDATLPWGLYIDNDAAAGGASTYGSRTRIVDSEINTARGIAGPSGLELRGDAGADVVTIDPTIIRGTLDLRLFAGQNSTTIENNTVIDQFIYVGGNGTDQVTLSDSRITSNIDIQLGDGADVMTIVDIDPATDLPPAVGNIMIDGEGNPADRLETDFGPLLGTILGFEFFVLL